ncbi:hypothetical protein PQX77_006182 [Marasmius sp. AFHP31]|nr:hypothetical protein PQX77_006182 [Marasmius sp. AFHP31]
MTIPYDVLIHIFAFSNTRELFNAALASRDLNVVASQYLYANVILSLPLWNTNASKGPGPRSGIAAFMFALLPKYAPFVRNLEVSGYFAGTSVQVNELQRALVKGLKAFVNIQSIKICPTTYEGNYFAEHLTILQECSSLRVLDVNSSCFDYGLQAMPVLPANPFSALFAIAESEEREEDPAEQVPHPLSRAELVANISGLTKLTLRDPSNTILQLLVRCWLNRLSKTLVELHLQV